jgi:hypothetical protein
MAETTEGRAMIVDGSTALCRPLQLVISAALMIGLAVAALGAGARPVPSPANRDGYYSVLDFGAKGDGATDDTAAFQKAADKAASRGGYVIVPPLGPGKGYVITRTVRLPRSVGLIGSPAGFGNNAWAAFDLPDKDIRGVKIFARPQASEYTAPKKRPLFLLEGGNTVRGLWILYDRQPWPTDQEFKDPKSPYYYESFEKAKANFVKDHVKSYGPTFYLPAAVNVVVEDIVCDRYFDFFFQGSGGKNVVSRVYLYGYKRGFVIKESYDVNRISDVYLGPNVGPACPGAVGNGKTYSWVYGIVVSHPDCVGVQLGRSDGFLFRDLFFYGVHTAIRFGASTAYPVWDPVEGVAFTNPDKASGPWGSISTLSVDCCNIGLHFVWPTTMTTCMLTNAYIATCFDDGTDFPAKLATRIARQGAFVVEPTYCMANNIGIIPTFMCSNAQVSSFGRSGGVAERFAESTASAGECNGRVFLVNGDITMDFSNLQLNAPYDTKNLYATGEHANRFSIRVRGLIETGQPKPDLSVGTGNRE